MRVNKTTPALFKKYKTARDYARADPKVFEQEIRSTGFYRNKTKNIIAACKIIDEKYAGKVPRTMKELIELPGIARKTGNIILSAGYGIVDGIPVDTHVTRVSQRLGLTKNTDPVKIEQDLMAALPKKDWWNFSNQLIHHGRYTCTAKKPKCSKCPLNKVCPSAFKVPGWQ